MTKKLTRRLTICKTDRVKWIGALITWSGYHAILTGFLREYATLLERRIKSQPIRVFGTSPLQKRQHVRPGFTLGALEGT
jgi:hypothetical protein